MKIVYLTKTAGCGFESHLSEDSSPTGRDSG